MRALRHIALSLFSWSLAAAGCRHAPIIDDRPGDEVRAARALSRQGKADEALKRFALLLKSQPDNLAVHRGYVEAAYFAGQLQQTREHYQSLQASRPGIAGYGLALVEMAAGPGRMREALAHLEQARQIMPQEADIPFRIGLVYALNGELSPARREFEEALRLDPGRPGVRVALANVAFQLGDAAKAIELLRLVPSQRPSPEEAQKAAALTARIYDPFRDLPGDLAQEAQRVLDLLEQEAAGEALAAAEQFCIRHPELSVGWTLQGIARSRLDSNAEAIVALERALELAPQSPLALISLGDVYRRTERWQKARELYERALALDPFDRGALERLADLAELRQDDGLAERALDTLILLEGDNPEPRLRRALILVRAERLPEAIEAYQDVLRIRPDHIEAMIRLAGLEVAMAQREPATRSSRRERARRLLEEARRLAPENQAIAELLQKLEE